MPDAVDLPRALDTCGRRGNPAQTDPEHARGQTQRAGRATAGHIGGFEPGTEEGREARRAVDNAIDALDRFTRAYLDHADPKNNENVEARRAFARDAGRLVLAVAVSVGGTLATLVASTLGDDARRLLEKLQDIGDNYDRTATTTSARKLLEVVVEGLVAIELKTLHMSAGLKSGPH